MTCRQLNYLRSMRTYRPLYRQTKEFGFLAVEPSNKRYVIGLYLPCLLRAYLTLWCVRGVE